MIRSIYFILAVCVFSLSFNGLAAANDGCPEFPKVVWWKTNHTKIISYVSRKHDGDWAPYLLKWNTQLHKMEDLHKRGGTAVFKSKGLRLEGEMLGQYVDAIRDRVAITRCLARREIANAGDKKNAVANDG